MVGQASSLNALWSELARFGKAYVGDCDLTTTQDKAVKAALSFFADTTLQWVLVLDDVYHWNDICTVVPLGLGGRMLVTSTEQSIPGLNVTELPLFTTDESLTVDPLGDKAFWWAIKACSAGDEHSQCKRKEDRSRFACRLKTSRFLR